MRLLSIWAVLAVLGAGGCIVDDAPTFRVLVETYPGERIVAGLGRETTTMDFVFHLHRRERWSTETTATVERALMVGAIDAPPPIVDLVIVPSNDRRSAKGRLSFETVPGGVYSIRFNAVEVESISSETAETYGVEGEFPREADIEHRHSMEWLRIARPCNYVEATRVTFSEDGRTLGVAFRFVQALPDGLELIGQYRSHTGELWVDGELVEPTYEPVKFSADSSLAQGPLEVGFSIDDPVLRERGVIEYRLESSGGLAGDFTRSLSCADAPFLSVLGANKSGGGVYEAQTFINTWAPWERDGGTADP